MSLNQRLGLIDIHDTRAALKGLYKDVQQRWEELSKKKLADTDFDNMQERNAALLELAHEQRGLVAAIAAINGLSVGLPLGATVYNCRVDRSVAGRGVVVHPREVGGEYEDSVVDEWEIADDFLEMIPVRWHEGESAVWVYFDDLARVPEL